MRSLSFIIGYVIIIIGFVKDRGHRRLACVHIMNDTCPLSLVCSFDAAYTLLVVIMTIMCVHRTRISRAAVCKHARFLKILSRVTKYTRVTHSCA